ncbi:MAG: hypothetical protein Q7S34_01850 [bacterium]|nr:hypothetical protein [bacterium]
MGKIKNPPTNIRYPYPKAVGEGFTIGKIIGRAMEIERFSKFGDYMRILDLVELQPDSRQKLHKELRFCQFYRRARGTDKDWIFGQGAGHMSVETFYKLIHKAKTKPDYGTFEGVFDKFMNKRVRRQRKI